MDLCLFHYPEHRVTSPPTNRAGRRKRVSKTARKVRASMESEYRLAKIRERAQWNASATQRGIVLSTLSTLVALPLAAYFLLF